MSNVNWVTMGYFSRLVGDMTSEKSGNPVHRLWFACVIRRMHSLYWLNGLMQLASHATTKPSVVKPVITAALWPVTPSTTLSLYSRVSVGLRVRAVRMVAYTATVIVKTS